MRKGFKLLPLLMLLLIIFIIPQSFAGDLNDTDLVSEVIAEDSLDDLELSDNQIEQENNIMNSKDVDSEPSISQEDSDSIYISSSGDDKNNGSYSAPYATFYRAINVAKDNGISNIYVFEGTYAEKNILIDTSVNIIGLGNVIIDAENEDRIFKIEGEYEVELSNLTLMNGNAPTDAVTEDIHEIVYHADGGAVDILGAYVKMINMTFINNYADDFGGAINIEGEYCLVRNCKFISNVAGVFGGAIDSEADFTEIDNCTFIANEASNGAAIGCIANGCKIINSHFENNVANDTGGAIFIENGDVSENGENSHLIENNKFINNEASQQGGAIEVENQQMDSSADWALIQNNEFRDNSAYNGGAISAYYGDAGIKNNLFVNNTAGYGGAIAAISTTDSPYIIIGGIYLKNNTIIDCKAEENGNAIFNMGYYGTALNITFIEGKTVYCTDGKAVILNVTVCDDMGNPISGSPLDFTVGDKVTINPASDLVEGVGSVRFVPRENGTFTVSGIYGSEYNMQYLYNVVTGTIVVENAIPDYFGTIYVSESKGDDDNTGAKDSPVKTFNQAFVLATRDGGSFDIVVYEGTYTAFGYFLEQSFNVTGIGNPVLDAKNQGNVFSLNGQIDDEFHITGITFKNGVASSSKYAGMSEGGLIFFKGGKLYLENNSFSYSSAKDYGGALHLNKGFDYNGGGSYAAFAYINNCKFDNNLADYYGGAISLYDCDVFVKNSEFSSNKAKKGGAISILNGLGNLTVTNSSFTDNFALEMGGALEIDALKTYSVPYFAKVINSTFKSNTANYGGAIVAGGSVITNCVFIGNSAKMYGGAIFNNETFLGESITNQTIVKNSIFDSNTAQKGLHYFGTSFLVNDNFWGSNFNSLNELLNKDIIFFADNNNALSWVNIKIDGLNDVSVGEFDYEIKFISNNGDNLTGVLPDYQVKLSNNISDNKLNVTNLVISNNKADVSYNVINLVPDTISVLNNMDNVLITSIDLKVKNENLTDENNTGNSSSVDSGNSTGTPSQPTVPTKTSTIKKSKQKTKLKVPKKTYKKSSKSKKIVIILKSASGKPLAKKKVTFKLNGKKYTARTNKKGKATVKVKLTAKKTYKFKVKFAGDSKYAAVSKKSSIRIK